MRVSLSPGDGLRRNDVVILILLLRLLSLLFVIELLVHDHSSPEEEALKEHAHRRFSSPFSSRHFLSLLAFAS